MASKTVFKSFAARKAEILRRNRWINRAWYELTGVYFLGVPVPFWLLLVCVLLPAMTLYVGATSSRPTYVFCDVKGMAFANASEAGSIPWMVTADGIKNGDEPGAMSGTQMTCDEAIRVFDLRQSEAHHQKKDQ
ncbi:hypothetical protein [Pseudomonas serbica]|uniref:hypothetical protein n=1 Tax=Pseudomonas serbica TaxID=2965074 RepID=UPI00237A6F24|nr:hypothetical protein [Pseudomonas serbica]